MRKTVPTFNSEELEEIEKFCRERIEIFRAEYYKPKANHDHWLNRIVFFEAFLEKVKELKGA